MQATIGVPAGGARLTKAVFHYIRGLSTIGRAMTGITDSNLDTRRRKALFRSWHRGMRETDLILGRFADRRVDALTATELEQYEALLEVPDADLLKWVTGESPVPATYDTELFREISAGRGR